jgi:secondary thiamine-phosphate synthase enzyme
MRDGDGSFEVSTRGRGTVDITREVQREVERSGVERGLCNVFVHHTSASLIVCENADPGVRADLEAFFARLVKDGDPLFRHDQEGPDDMPSHVRTVLTETSINVPIREGKLALGTWQGIYLWEHRHSPHRRRVTVTVIAAR